MRTADIHNDVLAILPAWTFYLEDAVEYMLSHPFKNTIRLNWTHVNQTFRQWGCEAVALLRSTAVDSEIKTRITHFFCSEGESPLRPLSQFCPGACNCSTGMSLCPTPQEPEKVACGAIKVDNVSLLSAAGCGQILPPGFDASGSYACYPNNYNGKHLYKRTDDAGVIWEIKWETESNLDWGAFFLGQHIGLSGKPKWTLTTHAELPSENERNQHRKYHKSSARYFLYTIDESNESAVIPPQEREWIPRNAYNTDFDCAAVGMNISGAGHFIADAYGTSCPTGYEPVDTLLQCMLAASALNASFDGKITDDAKGADGCFLYDLAGRLVGFRLHNIVNEPSPEEVVICKAW